MSLTLSAPLILSLVMDAFKRRLPFLATAFSTDFSGEQAKLNQEIIAHIQSLPAIQDYDAAQGGYKNGSVGAETLVDDVPVTIDQHKHVPINLSHLIAAQTVKQLDLVNKVTMDAAYVLAKAIVDHALSKVVAANFSEKTTQATANVDLDTLDTIRKAMNANGARTTGRFGIVNPGVMSALMDDTRVSSGDYYGQLMGEESLGHLKALKGFSNIYEYTDVPANAENLTGFFGTQEGVCIATRLPKDSSEIAGELGIPAVTKVETLTDKDTGLTLMGLLWQDQGTQNVYLSVTVMFGATAGKQGGDAGDATDYAGHRLVSA